MPAVIESAAAQSLSFHKIIDTPLPRAADTLKCPDIHGMLVAERAQHSSGWCRRDVRQGLMDEHGDPAIPMRTDYPPVIASLAGAGFELVRARMAGMTTVALRSTHRLPTHDTKPRLKMPL